MGLYNPYRNYDKGMDDAWCGKEPSSRTSQQYMEGYERALQIQEQDQPEPPIPALIAALQKYAE